MKKYKIKNGKPLARYVYEPYGKINPYLTNLDLDKNQYFYKGKFYYTGMEWEEELQLYNFKARYYDPYTMRFIQPDPVHTERTGFDNYDRYSYVNNNPVNFVDPDGRSFEISEHDTNLLYIINMFQDFGVNMNNLLIAFAIINFWMKSVNDKIMPPGYNYSGSGNRDPYSKFNNVHTGPRNYMMLYYFLTSSEAMKRFFNSASLSHEDAIITLYTLSRILPFVSPEPKTPYDIAGIYHDRMVPGSNSHFGGLDFFMNENTFDKAHIHADKVWLGEIWRRHFNPVQYWGKNWG
ncbi:MAG: hypothetical protein KatS3mg002_1715 [Candidatus Woesearchaeota archaeon]|nr:MAG: hypothetical protein KatS3mg002_1715 [Candidatus Woesearchaeota archaeon]